MNRAQQTRAERERRGRGARDTYVPYIQVRRGDFTSRGRSHIFPSPFFRRSHHLLSDLELHVLWAVFTTTPLDVREQFPLEWSELRESFSPAGPYTPGTLQIADELGVKHPEFGRSDPMRMTTDLLVQHQSGDWTAVHVKHSDELEDKRKTELRAIEQNYWRQRGVAFKVMTEKQINRTAMSNLAMAHSYDPGHLLRATRLWVRTVIQAARSMEMRLVTQALAARFGGSATAHANLIKYAIATGVLHLDLTREQLDWSTVWPEIRTSGIEL